MNPIERAIVLDEAKNYTDKQRIAYIESKTIATPKDAAGTDFWGTGNLYVRVHNETVDLKTLTKFQMESSTGENIWLSDYELEDNVVLQIVNTPGSDEEVPLIIRILINDEGVEPGVYVLWNGDHGVSCIQYETIHPIDPKYLPGVTLNLLDYGIDINPLILAGGGMAEVEDTGDFWEKVKEDRLQFVIGGLLGRFSFTASNVNKCHDSSGKIAQLSFSMQMCYSNAMIDAQVAISSLKSSTGAFIYVTGGETPVPTAEAG